MSVKDIFDRSAQEVRKRKRAICLNLRDLSNNAPIFLLSSHFIVKKAFACLLSIKKRFIVAFLLQVDHRQLSLRSFSFVEPLAMNGHKLDILVLFLFSLFW